jgi:hypothetical protein
MHPLRHQREKLLESVIMLVLLSEAGAALVL